MTAFKIQYQFSSAPWKYTGQNGWVFVSLPKKISNQIRSSFKKEEAGWGRLTATARIGSTEWKTAIWFDTKVNVYLLPLKADIRNKEKVVIGKKVTITVII